MTINWSDFEYNEDEYIETDWLRPTSQSINNREELEKAIDSIVHQVNYALFIIDNKRNRTLEFKNYDINNGGIPDIYIEIQETVTNSVKTKRNIFGKKKIYVEIKYTGYNSDGIETEVFNEKDISNIVIDFYEGKNSFGGLEFVNSFWKKISNNGNIFL